MSSDPPEIEYEIAERPVGAIVGAILLTMVMTAIGFIPIFVGFASERRSPGGYILLGALTGIGHIVVGLTMLLEVLFTVGTGRGKTIARLARSLSWISFSPTLDFFLGLFGVGFGTVFMFAYTQTIADLPRLPTYAIGYTLDGWLGIWIVWLSVLVGSVFWALWIDDVLGRDPVPRRIVELPEDDGGFEEYEEYEEYEEEEAEPPPRRRR